MGVILFRNDWDGDRNVEFPRFQDSSLARFQKQCATHIARLYPFTLNIFTGHTGLSFP